MPIPTQPTRTLIECLDAAALELVNCDASSDAHADEQLALATRLREAARRLREEMARAHQMTDERGPFNVMERVKAMPTLELLTRINGGPLSVESREAKS